MFSEPYWKLNNSSLRAFVILFSRRSSQQCEVTSSVGPYIPEPKSWSNSKPSWLSKPDNDIWNEVSWGNNGVIVDPINTYHMGVAIATRQTPFALLKSDTGTPVLVKVVDTKLPGGKQVNTLLLFTIYILIWNKCGFFLLIIYKYLVTIILTRNYSWLYSIQ